MAPLFKFCHYHFGNTGFDAVHTLVVKATWEIEGGLNVHSVIKDIGQHMRLADRLELTSHYTKRHNDATISGDERGEQCVQRALAWGNAIWVTWLDPEPGSSVLQQNAGPRCHHGGSKRGSD